MFGEEGVGGGSELQRRVWEGVSPSMGLEKTLLGSERGSYGW